MSPTINRCNNLHLLIHHPHNPLLLLHTTPAGHLPHFRTSVRPGQFFFNDTISFLPELSHHFHLAFELSLLRCVWYNHSNGAESADHVFDAILLLEAHGGTLHPPVGMAWVEAAGVVHPRGVGEDGREAIDKVLEELRSGVHPPQRPIFARLGWYDSTVEWVKKQLCRNNYPPVQRVTQVSCTFRGTTLKALLSDASCVYLKCSHFVNEAAVYNALAEIRPRLVARPIGYDVDRRLVLMRDHGEITTPFEFGGSETEDWVREFTEFQQGAMGERVRRRLEDAGLRVLPLERMISEFEEAFSCAYRLGLLSNEVMQGLGECSERIRRDCEEILTLGIPATFVHGDLFFTNVYRTTERDVTHGIIDFGESIISHPFIDALACRDPEAHARAWVAFLRREVPNREGDLENRILKCRRSLGRLRPFWEVMRMYYEMDDVETPVPPEMLIAFKGEIVCLLRSYQQS